MSEPFNLRAERMNAGYSIAQLADELGIHHRQIRRLEAGGSIGPANAKKIADKFGVKVTDLMPLDPTEAAA
jgi:transcriptional regulator with XRE-family HTH domain